MLILIELYLVILLGDILTDYVKIEVFKKSINHGLSAVIVAGLMLGAGVYVWFYEWADLWGIVRVSVVAVGFRWLFHDFLLNHMRGLERDYLGAGEGSAKTDRLLVFIEEKWGVNPLFVKWLYLMLSIVTSLIIELS